MDKDTPDYIFKKLWKGVKVLKNVGGITLKAETTRHVEIFYNDKRLGFFKVEGNPSGTRLSTDLYKYYTDINIYHSTIETHVSRFIRRVLKNIEDAPRDIREELDELRKIVPERFREEDPIKFLRKLATYIECLRFTQP